MAEAREYGGQKIVAILEEWQVRRDRPDPYRGLARRPSPPR